MSTQTERSTKEITTPGGHKVKLNEYLTGGELRKVQAIMMDGINATDLTIDKTQNLGMSKVPASAIFKAQEVALQYLILSVDECSKEEAYENAMNLRPADLSAIMEEVDEQIGAPSADKKKENLG
jgi:hypothetical protein